jgi:hypothetical protein
LRGDLAQRGGIAVEDVGDALRILIAAFVDGGLCASR